MDMGDGTRSDANANSNRNRQEAEKTSRAVPMKKRKSVHLEVPSGSGSGSGEQHLSPGFGNASNKKSAHGHEHSHGSVPLQANASPNSNSNSNLSPQINTNHDGLQLQALLQANASNLSPQINDVLLMGCDNSTRDTSLLSPSSPSPSRFSNHVGNIRLRILVKANLPAYFSGSSDSDEVVVATSSSNDNLSSKAQARAPQEDLISVMQKRIQKNNEIQNQVVENVMRSIVPSGRFMVNVQVQEVTTVPATLNNKWRLASLEESKAEVHSTFLAMGRSTSSSLSFFRDNAMSNAKSNPAMMALAAASSSSPKLMGSSSLLALQGFLKSENNGSSPLQQGQGAPAAEGLKEASALQLGASSGLQETVSVNQQQAISDIIAAFHAKINNEQFVIENNSSSSSAAAVLLNEALRRTISSGAESEPSGASGTSNTLNSDSTAANASKEVLAINEALQRTLGRSESAPASGPPVGTTANLNNSLLSSTTDSTPTSEGANFLTKGSMGINAILTEGNGNDTTVNVNVAAAASLQSQQQQQQRQRALLESLVPNYFPSRNTGNKAASSSASQGEKQSFPTTTNGYASSTSSSPQASSTSPLASSNADRNGGPISTHLSMVQAMLSQSKAMQEVAEKKEESSRVDAMVQAVLSQSKAQAGEKNKEETAQAVDANNAASSIHEVLHKRGSSTNTLAAAVNTVALLGDTQLTCPSRVKVMLALPMDRFFANEQGRGDAPSPSSPNSISPVPSQPTLSAIPSSSYIIPSNYDVLCGPGQAFFHHIGNRRFRIMIEMNTQRYEKAYYLAPSSSSSIGETTTSKNNNNNAGSEPPVDEHDSNSIQSLINERLFHLSKCDPPGRFLGMDMTTGRWKMLNSTFAQLKTEQTFFECLQVNQRRLARLQQEEEEQQQQQELQQQQQELHQQQELQQQQQELHQKQAQATANQMMEEEQRRRRLEMEKELLMKELESRMLISNSVANRSTFGSSAPPPALRLNSPQLELARQTTSRRVSQSQSSAGSSATACPPSVRDSNTLQLLAASNNDNGGEDLSSMSTTLSQARELIQRRHSAATAATMTTNTNPFYQAATAQSLMAAASLPTAEDLQGAAIAEIVKRFSQEQQQQQHQSTATEPLHALLSSLQGRTGALALPQGLAALVAAQSQTRRRSLPIHPSNLSSLTSSFSSQDVNNGGGGRSPAFPLMSSQRGSSNFPSQSQMDSMQSLARQQLQEVAGAAAATNNPSQVFPAERRLSQAEHDCIQSLARQQVQEVVGVAAATSNHPSQVATAEMRLSQAAAERRPSQTVASSSSSGGNGQNNTNNDFLDVVGGMMMMSRRSSR